ncbi:hypothetical protein D0860_03708 [Hortaea werneckii]|uniref:peptidyl-tRNA hydrolase n=1 Tax=Hortaea werneckii TaxID=91943 RepID=A0A3M7HBJ4_HORWE|nr:hypothetical protein D0860_03708 [Hortaea werneckii]RMZ32067.1 hypothetical protein D0859_03814 [Hortaea werneckii]
MAIDEHSARAKRMPRLPQRPPKRTEIERSESADAAQVAEDQASREEGGRKVVATSSGKRRKSSLDPPMTTTARNPGTTYANTLHSAGHTVVNSLAAHLGYAQFRKERAFGNGLISRPAISGSTGDWTLWQSTSYMNESGKGLKAAFTAWSKHIPVGEEGRVVVIYDELEKPLGSVTVRTNQGASARGHNGLKSILKLMRDVPFARIGIGIGRPVSRESNEVARYVLKKMTPPEKEKIDGSVEEVVKKLQQLERG